MVRTAASETIGGKGNRPDSSGVRRRLIAQGAAELLALALQHIGVDAIANSLSGLDAVLAYTQKKLAPTLGDSGPVTLDAPVPDCRHGVAPKPINLHLEPLDVVSFNGLDLGEQKI